MITHSTTPEFKHVEHEPNELRHAKGCPMDENRTEVIRATAPVSGESIVIARCLDCSAHVVIDESGNPFRVQDSLENEGEYGKDKQGERRSRRAVAE